MARVRFLDQVPVGFYEQNAGGGGGGGNPGGPFGSIQYNNAGAFAGSSNLIWNNSTNTLTVVGTVTATSFTGSLFGTASYSITTKAAGAQWGIQYNNNGILDANPYLYFDYAATPSSILYIGGSVASGDSTITNGSYSHAEGFGTTTNGNYSHAEGSGGMANGEISHAEGDSTIANGIASHAEGTATTASGSNSHAEGQSTVTYGISSHAEGDGTITYGVASHAEGQSTIAISNYQHTQGTFNLAVSGAGALIVGNGTSILNRSNLIFASGSLVQVTGSVIATQGFSGSLFGTASWASNALTASYIVQSVSASYASSSTSASYAATASYVVTAQTASYYGGSVISASYASSSTSASYAATSSYVVTAQTASYVLQAVSASFATTASYYGGSVISASYASSSTSASYATTASYVTTAQTASYVTIAQTASYVQTAQTASYVQTAQTASYVLQAVSASFAATSSLPLRGIITASAADTTITFTKGDGSTFDVTVSQSGSVATASYALFAEVAATASYVTASNVYGPYGSNSILSSSYALTASYSQNSSTSSYATEASNIIVYAKNQSGYNISKGMVVRITGSNNSSDIPRIVTASYENDNNSANTLGIAYQAIADGSEGYVITEGTLLGIDTSNFVSGQLIYLGATGSITGSAPMAPLHAVRLGEVIRQQSNNGSIYVRIDNGYELDELHNVLIVSQSSGDLLVASGSVWYNSKQLTGSYGLTGSLQATSFTGSLQGTSSWAVSSSQAVTASYIQTAQTASYVLQAVSASFATLAQTANTASYIVTAQTASYVLQAVSASFASTASFVQTAQTASYIITAQTASYVTGSIFSSTNPALSASYALSSSWAANGGVTQIIAGTNITLSPTNGLGAVTITSTGGGSPTQIATGSVTASVSLTQFSVISGSSTEFIVTGTGVTIGNVITDTHRVTGSINISGSVTATAFSGSFSGSFFGNGAGLTGVTATADTTVIEAQVWFLT